MKQLVKAGFDVEVDAAERADVAVINTCGFIGDAKEESVNAILEQVRLKKEGSLQRIYVMGCLSQRYGKELAEEIPEVDGIFGKFDWQGILKCLGSAYDESIRTSRLLTTPPHYAYLKIAEGCDRTCSYCAIPIMTGRYKSRDMEEIVEECRGLVCGGVKELLVMAQDLTYYGTDRYGKNRLAELVSRISDVPGVEWIRLHYAYPTGFPMELLPVMRERTNVCKYLDIALQHCTDRMLRLMRRGVTQAQTEALVARIREEVPGIFLRTTLMVGHPGETEEDFEALCDFVRRMRFERMGVFAYSHEEGTYCDKHYSDDVPQRVKRHRVSRLMDIQHGVAVEVSQSLVGKTLKVLVDRKEDDCYIGRTEYDSPEVDPEVTVKPAKGVKVGDFCEVKITGSQDYDLVGIPNLPNV